MLKRLISLMDAHITLFFIRSLFRSDALVVLRPQGAWQNQPMGPWNWHRTIVGFLNIFLKWSKNKEMEKNRLIFLFNPKN